MEQQIRSSVVDPRKFEKEAEYVHAQKTAWAYGQAYSDLLDRIENMVAEAEFLAEKQQGKLKDKLAESMS